MDKAIRIHDKDNVAVALFAMGKGATAESVVLFDDIPLGHKFALKTIAQGEPIVKYGYPIAVAKRDIQPGEHVHSHNAESMLRENLLELVYQLKVLEKRTESPASFEGYRRPDGRVGTRNEIWVIPTVGCVNRTAERIAEVARQRYSDPNIDGIFAFPHPFGCSQLGGDLENTQKILAGLATHPNAGGVLVVGLGCENNRLADLLSRIGPAYEGRIESFAAQNVGDELEEGLLRIEKLVAHAKEARREPVPAQDLVIGMKCGGSDGLSGITANPLIGRIADRVTCLGGTVLLTEVPEMFGAEQVLLERAADPRVFGAVVRLVNDFRDYFREHHEPIDENPSPGNKDGGITTLAEKSLGCVQKGGDAPIADVRPYGDKALPRQGGITLLCAPGNDAVSSTALTAAGANIILFSTGRGTPLGVPVPTVKISTNTALAEKKPSWIDFDAGVIAARKATFEQASDSLFAKILAIASGRERARNEVNGFREISIWKTGVTL